MANSQFVYVIYIRTTSEKVWEALTKPEFTRQIWAETWQESEWKKGSSWRLMIPDGRVGDTGEVLEIEPYEKLVLTWRNEFKPELKAERLFAHDLRVGAARRYRQAHCYPCYGQGRFQFYQGSIEWLAAHSFEPQEPPGNGRIAGDDS
jgi:hypothetical protein